MATQTFLVDSFKAWTPKVRSLATSTWLASQLVLVSKLCQSLAVRKLDKLSNCCGATWVFKLESSWLAHLSTTFCKFWTKGCGKVELSKAWYKSTICLACGLVPKPRSFCSSKVASWAPSCGLAITNTCVWLSSSIQACTLMAQ